MKITSKLNGLIWNIKTNNLSDEDIQFIENYNPTIYHNDTTCKLWAFDDKLPSGRWLENMIFNNEITECNALIL